MTLLVEKSPQALPLGAACIASSVKHYELTRDLCDVELLSFSMEDKNYIAANTSVENAGKFIADELLKKAGLSENQQNKGDRPLLQNQGDRPHLIVCFSVFVWNRPVLEVASKILQEKGALTIAGGPEITARPEAYKSFNYTIGGEGEVKVPALVARLLSAGENNETKGTDPSTSSISSPDLNTISSPYLDGTLDPAEFGGALWELARGCPFKCSYCYESKGEKTVRLFPMERVKAELDLFAKKKVPQVFVLDPTYNANKQRAIELLNLIAKKTPNTFYYFEARAEFIDKQMAQAFTKIPCAVQIGLQTANEEVAKIVHRPYNKKIFTKNIALLNNYGVIFGLDLIFGLPMDTFKSFKESVDFAVGLYPNNLEIFCLSVLPGTDLYDRAQELHLTFEENPPYHVLHTDRFSAQDLAVCEKIAKGCNVFYNDGRAVPWFNTILHAAKIRPNQFFLQFAEWLEKQKIPADNCKKHKDIEQLQLQFVNHLFNQKNLVRLYKAAADIIIFNGAISRKTASGETQFINLNYPVEYIDSEYSLDLEFFVHNVKIKPNKFKI